MAAFGTLITRHAFPRIAADKISLYRVSDDMPEEAVVLRVGAVISLMEVFEMLMDDFKQRALIEPPWLVTGLHGAMLWQEACRSPAV